MKLHDVGYKGDSFPDAATGFNFEHFLDLKRCPIHGRERWGDVCGYESQESSISSREDAGAVRVTKLVPHGTEAVLLVKLFASSEPFSFYLPNSHACRLVRPDGS